jgi:hypothetical protein
VIFGNPWDCQQLKPPALQGRYGYSAMPGMLQLGMLAYQIQYEITLTTIQSYTLT